MRDLVTIFGFIQIYLDLVFALKFNIYLFQTKINEIMYFLTFFTILN